MGWAARANPTARAKQAGEIGPKPKAERAAGRDELRFLKLWSALAAIVTAKRQQQSA